MRYISLKSTLFGVDPRNPQASHCKQCDEKTEQATIIVVAVNVRRNEVPKCRLRLLVFASLVRARHTPQKNATLTDCVFKMAGWTRLELNSLAQ